MNYHFDLNEIVSIFVRVKQFKTKKLWQKQQEVTKVKTKRLDLEFMQKPKCQVIRIPKTTKKLTKVRDDNFKKKGLII